MRLALIFFGLLIICNPAYSAALNVWPVKVTISPKRSTESVHLTNNSDTPVNVQISANSWDIDESGKFIEADTGDFVFFPRLLTIPPNDEKVVRVGYQGDFPSLEKPYRLIVQELPPVKKPEDSTKDKRTAGLGYVLRLSLPLFVMPEEQPVAPEIAIEGIQASTNGLKVGVKAPGNHHIQVTKVEAELLNKKNESMSNGEAKTHLLRILPQRRVFVDIPMNTQACDKATNLQVKVHAEGLNKPYEETLPLSAESCRAKM